MKRFFTLLVAFFTVAFSFAAVNVSRLTISAFGNTTLAINIDGKQYDRVEGSITLDALRSGYHDIKVYEVRNERRFLRNINSYRLLYASSLLLKPEYHTNIAINRAGEVVLREQLLNPRGRGDDRNGYYGKDNGRWNDRRDDDRRNDGRDDDRRDDRRDERRNDNRQDNYDSRGYNQPMNDRTFNAAKDAVRRESFDKDKATLAKQIIANNTVNTSQVKEMMQLFSFDDAKLDFAKFAYARTTDRNNYFMLYDSFSFRKNKEELANFIQSYRF